MAKGLKLETASRGKLLQTAATYRSHKWVDETGSDASANISNRQNKSSGYALLVRHVGQGQVSLCHADGQ